MEKSKARRTSGLFVAEGVREITACIRNGYELESLFFAPDILPEKEVEALLALGETAGIPLRHLYRVTKPVYAKIAYREGTEGVVAVIREKRLKLDEVVLPGAMQSKGAASVPSRNRKANPRSPVIGESSPQETTGTRNALVLVLESVEKPGNLGALLRTADACGVDAVLICDPLTDLYNPNLIRASLGGIFTQQVVACTNDEAYQWLQKHRIAIFTAQLQDSQWYYDSNLVQPCALVMGSEANGLTGFWREVSDAKIKIPMLGELDSLNVSVSAAVLCYEAVRQRNIKI